MSLTFLPHWIADYKLQKIQIEQFPNEGCHLCRQHLDLDSVEVVEAPGHVLHQKCWQVWMEQVLGNGTCAYCANKEVVFVDTKVPIKKIPRTRSRLNISKLTQEGSQSERNDLLSKKENDIRGQNNAFFKAVQTGDITQASNIYALGNVTEMTIRLGLDCIKNDEALTNSIKQLVHQPSNWDQLCKKVTHIFTCCLKRA